MANEMRLVDANELLRRFQKRREDFASAWRTFKAIPDTAKIQYHEMLASAIIVEDLPTVDAVPVVHGRWEKEDQSGISIDGYMVCSVCNVMIPKPDDNRYCLNRLNFCPNCGADMRGDRDGRKDP